MPVATLLTILLYQGQHPGRSKWPRTSSRFRVPHHRLRRHLVKFVRGRWHDTMDESRALLSRQVRHRERSTDETIGLLRIRDGHLRGSHRSTALRNLQLLRRNVQGYSRRTSVEAKWTRGSAVHGRLVANVEPVLGGSTTTPAQRHNCPRAVGAGFCHRQDALFTFGREHRVR